MLPLRLLPGGLIFLTVASVASAGIDFTPRTLQREEDGLNRNLTYLIPAPGQRAVIQPPAGWVLTGGPAGLETRPPDLPGASVSLRASPFGGELPAFDPKGLEIYRRRVLAGVPPGSTAIRITGEQLDPLNLFGWKTFEFVVAWELGGQFWQESVVFVTLTPREGMIGVAAGTRAGYNTVRGGLFTLLSSWCRERG